MSNRDSKGPTGGTPAQKAEPDAGMGVVRRQRRSTLEKALRGGASDEAERPNAASAWGNMLQKEVREEQRPAEPSKPGAASGQAARSAPAVPSQPSGPLPPIQSERPRRIEGEPSFRADRAPSTAVPEELTSPPVGLSRQAGRLADDHDRREAESGFRVGSLGVGGRVVVSVLLLVSAAFLAVWPSFVEASRQADQRVLAGALAEGLAALEADPRLGPALQSADLPTIRDVFTRKREAVRDALRSAGFPADENTARIRLTQGGHAIALSADFDRADGDGISATRTTGSAVPLPEASGFFSVLWEESLWTTLAYLTFAAAAIGALWLFPGWQRRRRARSA